MLIQIIIFIIGLILIIRGGDWFVDASVSIAEIFQLPRILIGATIVSIGTTLPELTVSSMASFLQDSGIAYGNAVGTVIANTGLIVGIILIMNPVTVDASDFRLRGFIMLGLALLAMIFGYNLAITRVEGGILLLMAVIYIGINIRLALTTKGATEEPQNNPNLSLKKSILLFIIGVALVLLGSHFMVKAGIAIATALGIPSVIIGLTMMAIGTSLPELTTAIISSRKGVADLSIGNIVGANILNLSLITGTAALIHPLTLTRITKIFSFPWLALFTILFFSFFFYGRAGKKQGVLMLSLFILYIMGLIATTYAVQLKWISPN